MDENNEALAKKLGMLVEDLAKVQEDSKAADELTKKIAGLVPDGTPAHIVVMALACIHAKVLFQCSRPDMLQEQMRIYINAVVVELRSEVDGGKKNV